MALSRTLAMIVFHQYISWDMVSHWWWVARSLVVGVATQHQPLSFS